MSDHAPIGEGGEKDNILWIVFDWLVLGFVIVYVCTKIVV